MLCRRCFPLYRASALQPQGGGVLQSQFRQLSTTSKTSPPSQEQNKPTREPTKPPSEPPPISSTPPGTPLRGLNFLKNRAEPLALPDADYPDWLWRCLDSPTASAHKGTNPTTSNEGDLFSKSAKLRRTAAKALRRAAATQAVPQVPLHKQSVDLPGNEARTAGGAMDAARGRAEVTKEMRKGRRAGIREGNFLRGMR